MTDHSESTLEKAHMRVLSMEDLLHPGISEETSEALLRVCQEHGKRGLIHMNVPCLGIGDKKYALYRDASDIGKIFQYFKEGSGGMLSTCVGGDPLSFDPVPAWLDPLVRTLNSLGYGCIGTTGIWKNQESNEWEFQVSEFVPNITEKYLRRLGARFHQRSVVLYDRGTWRAIDLLTDETIQGVGFHVLIGKYPEEVEAYASGLIDRLTHRWGPRARE